LIMNPHWENPAEPQGQHSWALNRIPWEHSHCVTGFGQNFPYPTEADRAVERESMPIRLCLL
jgi:hypothetical protein